MQRERRSWRRRMRGWSTRRLVFIDETATKTNMTRSYARAPRGQRIVEAVPAGHWQTNTLIQAIDQQGVRAALIIPGASDTLVFEAFTEQILVPQLRRDDIVVLDNLSSHKSLRTRELIEDAGAQLWFLPPYSPDLNPIEKIFSKVKAWLRSAKARAQDKLWDAIAAALQNIQPTDCLNSFHACGYHAT